MADRLRLTHLITFINESVICALGSHLAQTNEEWSFRSSFFLSTKQVLHLLQSIYFILIKNNVKEMHLMKKFAIILAAGKGTRMHSNLPKVMHTVCGTPMVEHLVDKLEALNIDEIIVIVGHGSDIVKNHLGKRVTFIEQSLQLGTGHVVQQAQQYLENEEGSTLILTGDTPLLSDRTILNMFNFKNEAQGVVLTTHQDNPFGYGRIIRNEDGSIQKIVEEKDANYEQQQTKEVNTGIFCFDNQTLFAHIEELTNSNVQQELYLTDMVEIFAKNNKRFASHFIQNSDEVTGINDRLALSKAEKYMRRLIAEKHMLRGVTLIDPDSTYIDNDVIIGANSTIHPNVSLQGRTSIGEHSIIGMNTEIKDSDIGSNVSVKQSVIHDSFIGNHATVGPFAHIRPETDIKENCRIGNFVEIKKSIVGKNSKVSHLSYIGDADIGQNVNVGCGSITVNYDGKEKHKTTIKDGSFIGCNVNLVAPITIGENSMIAAGSTITKDVPEGALAIARNHQVNKEVYASKLLDTNKTHDSIK